MRHLQGHFSAVTSLALTPNGWGLLSAGRDKTAMLWDLRSHARLATVPLYEAVEGVLFSATLCACMHVCVRDCSLMAVGPRLRSSQCGPCMSSLLPLTLPRSAWLLQPI